MSTATRNFTFSDAALCQHRLSEIADAFHLRQNDCESDAADAVRLKRQFELRLARALVVAEGGSEGIRKANALIAVAAADDDLYGRLEETEAKVAGHRAVMNALEAEAMVLQSILKAQGRS